MRDLLDEKALSAGHARALLATPDPEAMARAVITNGLNVRQTERLVKRAAAGLVAALNPPPPRDPDIVKLEHDLGETLGLKVKLIARGEAGELRIAYRSLEQLDDVIARLKA